MVALLLALASLAIAVPAALAQDEGRVVFHVALSGADPEGQGEAVLRFDPGTGTLCYVIVVRGIGAPTEPAAGIGDAHIHGPLPATGIAVDLQTDFAQRGASDVFGAADCVAVDAATLDAILANPSLFYINVHTAEFPGGAVAGALG
jgi:CHRD domain